MSEPFGNMILINSFWAVFFLVFILFISCKHVTIGIIILFSLAIFLAIYLDHQVNHNEDITVN